MKYQYLNEPIPQEARQELNDKILYLVDQDLAEQSGISREDIYNAYTGDGGLHGLKRSDFANYHEYAEAKKEIENGQFFTPPGSLPVYHGGAVPCYGRNGSRPHLWHRQLL